MLTVSLSTSLAGNRQNLIASFLRDQGRAIVPIDCANNSVTVDCGLLRRLTQNSRNILSLAAKNNLQLIDFCKYNGGPCRNRTYDQKIKSLLLYQLS